MKIIIIGAGEVGVHLARHLSKEHHDITLIEEKSKRAQSIQDEMDIMVIEGNGASPEVLRKAGLAQCDLFLAVTNMDEVNMVASLSASRYNVPFKIARVSNMHFYDLDNYLGGKNLGTDLLINPEFECALQVANLLKIPGASEYAEFAGGDVFLFGLSIAEGAPCLKSSLQELRQDIEDIHFLVGSISRGAETFIPKGHTVLKAGDQAYFIAQRNHLDQVYDFCGIEKKPVKRVMILGGSKVSRYLCQILEKQNIKATLVVPDEFEAERMAEDLTNTLIINGDVKDFDLLLQEGLSDIDCFLALTPRDEDNMLTGIFAREKKVPYVIALLGKLEYLPVFNKMGVNTSVSPRVAVTNSILKYARTGNITSVATIQNSQTEIMEFEVAAGSFVEGKPLRDLKLPRDVMLAMVHRDYNDFIPSGDSVLRPKDHVVAITISKDHHKLEKLFT
ncbi:MAG: Trk system potassium transporter TrkA [Acidobacteria bacterium]|nr:MAG: Trk system potassium transporter TrkA [Acidobacteriota bacterium]